MEPTEDGRIRLRIRLLLRSEPDPPRGKRIDLNEQQLRDLRSMAETASNVEVRRAAAAVRAFAKGDSLKKAADAAGRTTGWLRRLLQHVETGGIKSLEGIWYRPNRSTGKR